MDNGVRNKDIKMKAKLAGVKLWEICEVLAISDSAFSKLLRKEFTEKNKQNIFNIIDRIASGRDGEYGKANYDE